MKTEIKSPAKSRIYYLDVMRCVACMLIVLAHASANYTVENIGSLNYYIGAIFDFLPRFAVPSFVMISGCLFLDENYQYSKEKLVGHLKKMILFFVVWSAFYTVFYEVVKPVFEHTEISPMGIVSMFFKGTTHLWFVYMIIGLYLLLPLLRLWVKDENKKYVEYFLVLSVIFSFLIPQLLDLLSPYSYYISFVKDIMDSLNVKYVCGYTTYFILGWYINKYGVKNQKLLYFLGVLSAFITVGATIALSVARGEEVSVYGNMTVNVLIYTVMFFNLMKNVISGDKKHNKLVLSISKYSLGIYAIHPFVISVVSTLLKKIGIVDAYITIPIVFVVAFISSYIGSLILSKIPFFKKIV